MGTVLEDVAGGHGGIAESVNEDSFELALQEVGAQQGTNQLLYIGGIGKRLIEVVVDVWPKRVEEKRGDQERTEIFNDEYSSPSDLGA